MAKSKSLLDCTLHGLPPSVNRMYRGMTGKRYKPREVLRWEAVTIASLMSAYRRKGGLPYDGPVSVVLLFRRQTNVDFDVDNRLKAMLDALERAGVIENDKQVQQVTARKELGTGEPDSTVVTVSTTGQEHSGNRTNRRRSS